MPNQEWEDLKKRRDPEWASMFADIAALGWEIVELFPEGAPHFDPAFGQVPPRLAVLPPHEGKARGMVIVCAGGAFAFKSYNEARPVAERFYNAGLNAAVLDYRVQPYPQSDSCLDALRAIRYLRKNAARYNTLPDHIAIGGFSAGGMLSGMAATRFDSGHADDPNPVERVSSRPDAALLLYGAFCPARNVTSGLGYDAARQNELARNSNDKNLRYDCPPFFLFQTAKDDPRSVLQMGTELADRGIPFEAHIFPDGMHGQGLYNGENGVQNVPHTAHWSMLAIEWLEGLGF